MSLNVECKSFKIDINIETFLHKMFKV
jgi:hypothetical protein